MNFVFIIDTSLTMNQKFDNISFFDMAKSSIRKFVLDREINNYKLNRNKADKYFLVSLNKNQENFIDSWSTTTEHFLIQLNALKITYDFTNIDYAIKKSFQMINFIKNIGYEKHVYGRLFSKIQNSYIILITDGGKFSSNEKIISLNSSTQFLKEPNEKILENYPNIYKELNRWDHSIFAIVLTDKNNDFESFKILDKICKNCGGKIITVDNPNSLTDKLNELNFKCFTNNRVYINFNINKIKKKHFITYLEYNGNIDKMNEKWPFPDELIINKDISILPTKNSIPFYEFGNIKYNISLSQEYYDEYEIKDKKFIITVLTDGDCWNNLTLSDFIKLYNSSLTIDVLVSDLKNKQVIKKPFGVVSLIFTKELIDFIKETISNKGNLFFNKFFYDFQNFYNMNNNKSSNIYNHIKCKFFNLPYYYTEFFSLIKKYNKNPVDYGLAEMQLNLEKYFNIIPFYYIKYIINFLEKNKIKKLFNKDKESIKNIINENFSKGVLCEIEKLSQLDSQKVGKINKLFSENKKNHSEKKARCCKKEEIYSNRNNFNIINKKKNTEEEDNDYLNFINNCFKPDKINRIGLLNHNISSNNSNNLEFNFGNRNGYQLNKNNNDNNHEMDIEFMGDYRDYFFRNEHLRSYLVPEIEIRYLIKDFFFGNQFIERKKIYSPNQIGNNSMINNEDESIFHYLNDEDNNNNTNIYNSNTNLIYNNTKTNNNNIIDNNKINDNKSESLDIQIKKANINQNKEKNNMNFLNNKRNREKGSEKINDISSLNASINTDVSSLDDFSSSSIIFNDNFSESDGSNNLMLDEFSEHKNDSKLTSKLIEEFKNSINFDDKEIEEGVKFSVKYEISKEKLNKWKFQKKIKNLSQELINSIHNDETNIIKVINKIIDKHYYEPSKIMIHNFIEKLFYICQSFGVNPIILAQIKNMVKLYE